MGLIRKVVLLQMTLSLVTSKLMMTEMLKKRKDQVLLGDTRNTRDIGQHIGRDGRVRAFRRGRDKNLGGDRPVLDVPDGFDLSSAERQEDGQFCVYKKLSLEGIIFSSGSISSSHRAFCILNLAAKTQVEAIYIIGRNIVFV